MPFRLARQGVFYTVQGEGVMMGTPQVFVRLAGCNVGCPECDTDYRPAQMVTLEELARLIVAAAPPDGLTLLLGAASSFTVLPHLRKLHYSIDSFECAGGIADYIAVMAVRLA